MRWHMTRNGTRGDPGWEANGTSGTEGTLRAINTYRYTKISKIQYRQPPRGEGENKNKIGSEQKKKRKHEKFWSQGMFESYGIPMDRKLFHCTPNARIAFAK